MQWNLEEDGQDNTPGPTKLPKSIATYPNVFQEVMQWFSRAIGSAFVLKDTANSACLG